MKVFTVKNYFTHAKWSYYPGDVLTPELCAARGLDADAIAHYARRDNLVEGETADPPAPPDPIDFSLLAPVPESAPEPAPEPAAGAKTSSRKG